MFIPSDTRSLLEILEKTYPDSYEIEEVSTPEYWKKAGVIELLRLIRESIGGTELKNINSRGD